MLTSFEVCAITLATFIFRERKRGCEQPGTVIFIIAEYRQGLFFDTTLPSSHHHQKQEHSHGQTGERGLHPFYNCSSVPTFNAFLLPSRNAVPVTKQTQAECDITILLITS
jgi:hypothetical protein